MIDGDSVEKKVNWGEISDLNSGHTPNEWGVVKKAKLKQNVIVAYDDIDLPLGTIRLRPTGGTGGHRGVESIIYHLKSENYNRLRLGIATDEHMRPAEKYVLKPFSDKYNDEIKIIINQACDALEFFLDNGIIETMNKFN